MSYVMKWLNRIENAVYLAGIGGIGILALYTTTNVFMRRLFNMPLPAHVSISEFLIVVIVFFLLAGTQRAGGHLAVEVVFRKLPRRVQHIANVFTLLFALVVFVIISQRIAVRAYDAWMIGEVYHDMINIPLYLPRALAAVGAFLLTLRFAAQLVNEVKILVTGRYLSKE